MIITKTRAEIQKMYGAGQLVAQVLRQLSRLVTPGITTSELDIYAEKCIRDAGAIPTFKGYRGYPYSICTSVNEQVVHGFPSERILKEGDIISIDCGATLAGYVGDSAITIPVGRVSDEAQKLVDVTRESLYQAIEKMQVGNRLYDVSYAVQSYAESRGYTVVRDFCGHGIGTAMHEEPQVPNYGKPGKGPRLREGWVLAIEPMVNVGSYQVKIEKDGWTVTTIDKRLSAHFEHTIAILSEGPWVLTQLNS
ncbi:MAG: type I methionyl aminopeptidase [Blastocatellia bacterium]|nr:type I methionyl aminopeptidase [Blastocatellia bacterium]MBL8192988.1 type I methionyl aminopeptidase [Blastocatellia bacterium]MBN8723241.1 type I methionyl aminopeptidase [Acidobacteriota bacterium]